MGKLEHDIPDITVVVTKGDEYTTAVTPSELYQVIVNTGDSFIVNVDDSSVIVTDGSGSYIKVADYATYALTSSFAQTASYISGSASDWTYITNKPVGLVSSSQQATTWTVATASYATNAILPTGVVSSSAQIKTLLPAGTISSSTQINTGSFTGSFTGRFTGTGSWAQNAITASYATNAVLPTGLVSSSGQINLNQITGTTFNSASYLFPQNVTVQGILSASELRVTKIVSQSIVSISGSNIFGSNSTDLQQFTGSVVFNNGATGSLEGTASFANNINLSGVIGNQTLATTGSNTFVGNQTISGSIVLNGGNVEFVSTKVTDVFDQTKLIDPLISSLNYSGVNVEYTAQRIGEIRSGLIMASWSGSDITYTDISNVEIGSVYDLNFNFVKIGDDIRFRAYSAGVGSSAWTIQFLFKLFPNLL